MNRKQQFENTQFYQNFKIIENKITEIDHNQTTTDQNLLAEYERFKKVVAFIRTSIEVLDFDLIIESDIQNLEGYSHLINNILDHMGDINNIPSITTWIDECLQYIKNTFLILAYPNKKIVDSILNKSQFEQNILALKNEVNHKKEEVFLEIKNTKKAVQESSKKLNAIDKFHDKIFGSLNEKTKKREKGFYVQLKDLIHNATSVGLAKAFFKESKSLKMGIWIWTGGFVASIIVSFRIALSLKEGIDITMTEGIIEFVIKSFPMSFLIWLSIFCAKRRSEANMLYQEYKHKETFASSYSSYKNQLDYTKQTDQDLLPKLISNALDVIAKNPGKVLEKEQDTSLPAKEISKLLQSIANNLPTAQSAELLKLITNFLKKNGK